MSMFDGMTDAHIAHAVRMAERHYLSIGADPLRSDVALAVIRDSSPPNPNETQKGVELLALPEWANSNRHLRLNEAGIQRRLREYARANVEASVAELRAELESRVRELRIETDRANSQYDRAERLAEALRECRSDYEHALGISENIYRHWCNTGANGAMPNDTWARHCARRIEQIDALTTPAQPGETE